MTAMGFIDTALSVTLGNIVTICIVWACYQFHKHDHRAPWTAYVAFILPMLLIAGTVLVTEGLPIRYDG